MSKKFVIGDIHGAYKALIQCIEKSGIDKENDQLIVLGDVVDGWPQVAEVVEELLTFDRLIKVRGNHDQWFMDWVRTGEASPAWVQQGGMATIDSYNNNAILIDEHMKEYFNNTVHYFVDNKNQAYMHGGYDWHKPISENENDRLLWDRHMYQTAMQWESFAITHPTEKKEYFKEFSRVFVGHTSTQIPIGWKYTPGTDPVLATNLVNLDTGAGWSGKLTIMNANDPEEYYQSDIVETLYPKETNARR